MLIRVKVKTNAKKEEITAQPKNIFAVSLKEKPVQNIANKRLVLVIGKHLRIPIANIRIVRGHKAPTKVIQIKDLL
jgi:uncharacterized protein YggU (UPF0235/DUF167 family)